MSTSLPTNQTRGFGLAIAGVVAHVGLVMALFALLAFIVPAAKRTFDEYGMSLPWITQSVIRVSNWVAAFWWALVPVMLLAGAADFGLLTVLGSRNRSAALLWIAFASLVLVFAIAVTVMAIELPREKLREGLGR